MATGSKKKSIRLEIAEDWVKIEYENEGVKTERIGDINTLTDVFKSIETSIILPILPNNCRRLIKKGNQLFVFSYYEEGIIKDFKYFEEVLDIPVPKTIILNVVQDLGAEKYRLLDTTFFPIKDTYLNNDNIQLYYWPFPNQSPEFKGRVCWGNDPNIVSFRRSCDLFNLSSIYHLFFAAKGNDDYGWAFGTKEHKMPDYLRGAKEFPYHKLKETGHTMKSLINLLTTGPNLIR